MRRILIELQLEGELEEEYENISDEFTVEDLIDCPHCQYFIKQITPNKEK